MRRSVAVVALGLTVAAVVALGAAAPATTADPDVDRYLTATVPDGASGTFVAVRGRHVTCRGFGLADRGQGIPADCETVYDIGSVTKQFTAAAVVKLQMMRRLDEHDPLRRWIPRVPRDKSGITIQQLLTHTSGMVDSLGDDYDHVSRRQLVSRALHEPLRTAPGRAYHYSNLGYSLLAVVVERASGVDYERFLRRHLFLPAGMRSTGYVIPDWSRRTVAIEYDASGEPHGRPFEHPWATSGPWWNLRGNGGMLSTARDMVRWHRALSAGRVLDRRAQRELFRPRVREEVDSRGYYGYGWVLYQTRHGTMAWHNGGNDWSYAELSRILHRRTMTFWVTNQMRDRAGGWNLSRLGITLGLLGRLW